MYLTINGGFLHLIRKDGDKNKRILQYLHIEVVDWIFEFVVERGEYCRTGGGGGVTRWPFNFSLQQPFVNLPKIQK